MTDEAAIRLGRRRRGVASAALAAVLFGVTACSGPFPRDVDGSLERISGGVLRVGISDNPPLARYDDAGRATGREVDLVTGFADSEGADIEWTPGSESELVMALKRGDLDIVIGGLLADSPWQKEVALSQHYATETTPDGDTEKHVMATTLGENALLVALETYLAHRGEAR